jgi:hypothetical protein
MEFCYIGQLFALKDPSYVILALGLTAVAVEQVKRTAYKGQYVNFRCIYFRMKMVIRPKHVADSLNKIANNY